MSSQNNERPVLVHFKKKPRWLTPLLVFSAIALGLVLWRFDLLPLPEDAGPTVLASERRITVVESVDFRCDAAATSLNTMSAYNPGWKWDLPGPLDPSGGQAYVFFDTVGGFDVCLWGNDYVAVEDHDNGLLVVTVERLDARRPALLFAPVELNGKVYQTLELNTLDQDMIADANVDRVIFEGVRNAFSGDDESYMLTQTIQLLRYAEAELVNTSCLDDAMRVVEEGLRRYFFAQALDKGLHDLELVMPESLDIPDNFEELDFGDTELERHGHEQCFVREWTASPLNDEASAGAG